MVDWTRLQTWGRRAHTVAGWVPLTASGVVVGVASAGALGWWGLQRQDIVLFIVGLVGVVVLAVGMLATLLGGLLTVRSLRTARGRYGELECAEATATGFSLPRLGWLPVELSWTWVAPDALVRCTRVDGRLRETVVPTRRGRVERVTRRFVVSDLLGLARVRFDRTEEVALVVHPAVGALHALSLVHDLVAGDHQPHPDGTPVGDRVDMRRYAPGDPMRYILWKVYARTRSLMVRSPERALSPGRQTVGYLVAGEGDQAAAGSARLAVTHRALGVDTVLGADGARGIADDPATAQAFIVQSGTVHPDDGGADLARFLDTVRTQGAHRALVFVPPSPGPWLERALAAAATPGWGARVDFLVCLDGVRYARERLPAWAVTEDEVRPGEVVVDADVLAGVVRRLAAAGSLVRVVDRASGQVFDADALQEVGA